MIRIVLDNATAPEAAARIVDADSKNPAIANDLLSFFCRPPQGPAARAGRAPRSRRCGAGAAGRRAGRPPADRPPRRGARQIPRNRRRQEPARRLQARRQHPAHRGEEGRHDLSRQAGPAPLSPARGARARRRDPCREGGSRQGGRARGLRGRHGGDRQAAPACRCVLRQGDGQRPDRRPAREPAQAAERNPRGDARGRGFLARSRDERRSLSTAATRLRRTSRSRSRPSCR